MGGKQARKRKLLLFHFANYLILLFCVPACCHLPFVLETKYPLEGIKGSISKGKYDQALAEAQALLRNQPEVNEDEVLYLIGMIYAHPNNPKSDWEQAGRNFRMLMNQYPSSEWVQPAEVWVSLFNKIMTSREQITELTAQVSEKQKEVDALKTQMDELKKIDLGTEEEKRNSLPR